MINAANPCSRTHDQAPRAGSRWSELAERSLAGHQLAHDDALEVLHAPDAEILAVMHAAYQVRHRFFGNRVQLYMLVNAKSGLCPEDCNYCSQSKISDATIAKYSLLSREKLLDGAAQASKRGATTYCIVISGRSPTQRELEAVEAIVPEIKARYSLKICACLGLLTLPEAQRLKACGVDRVNHNLNTSREFYARICTTHSYDDRLATLHAVRDAGLELCAGGIVGMGEHPTDIVQMALALRGLNVESIPINFLHPVDGTPLAQTRLLNPRFCLKVLAMFRFVHPNREIRIAGGRELHLGALQPLGLYAANSIFVGDYLTTPGQTPDDDLRMIRDMGFEPV
jgi:biotin synthase